MKYFTESIFSKVLPVLVCLVYFSTNLSAQPQTNCSFATAGLVDSIEISGSNDTIRSISFTQLEGILNPDCPDEPTFRNKIFYLHPNGVDTVRLRDDVAPSDNPGDGFYVRPLIRVACKQYEDLDLGPMSPDSLVVSGTSVTFISAPNLTYIRGDSIQIDKKNVVLYIRDIIPPVVVAPRDTSISCMADTSGTGAFSPLRGASAVENCSAPKDTFYINENIAGPFVSDTIQFLRRIWMVSDSSDNIGRDTQLVAIIDTIPPIWDTVQVNIMGMRSDTLPNDRICVNTTNDTLQVFLDTSGVANSDFWVNQFKPSAIDSCFGMADTLSSNNVTQIGTNQTTIYTSCETITPVGSCGFGSVDDVVMRIERRFNANDTTNNFIESLPIDAPDSSFVLQIFFIDTLSPIIVDTPFYDNGLDGIVDAFSADVSANTIKVDTFIVFNDKDSCSARIDSAAIDIVANDNFSKDTVLYDWKVETLSGMAPDTLTSPTGFAMNGNVAAQTYPVGLHKITYLYKDSICDNLDSLQFVLEVRDTQAPVVVTDTFDFVLYYNSVNAGDCDQEFTFQQGGLGSTFINDNCGATPAEISITRELSADSDPNIFTSSNQGAFGVSEYGSNITVDLPIDTTTIFYIYEDLQGNKDTITYIFDVRDTVPPTVNCVSSIPDLIVNGINCTGALPDYRTSVFVNANDVCGLDSIEQKPAPGFMISRDTIITFIAVDNSGNKDSCSLPLQVRGVQEPVLTDTTTQCTQLTLEAPLAVYNCTDSVRLIPFSNEPPNGTNPQSYTFSQMGSNSRTISWIFNDENGNFVKFISQEITFIADTTNPTLVLPAGTVTLNLDTMGMITVDPSDLDNGSFDNCSPQDSLKLSTDITEIPCDSLGKTFDIRLYVADELMNIDSADITVTIADALPPIFVDVPRDTVWSCDQPIPGQLMLTVMENCGTIDTMYMDTINTQTVLDTPTVANLRPDTTIGFTNYSVTYRWIAEDSNMNRDTATQVITVVDTLAPTIDYPDTMLVGTSASATTCTADITIDLVGKIKDNCYDTLKYVSILDETKTIEYTDTNSVMLTVPMGDTTVFIIAEDFANNRDTQALTIVVDDMTDPRPVCVNAVAISVNAFGFVVIDSADINLNSTDNCTGPTDLRFELSRDTFRCEDVGGTYEVIMTAIDEAGNRASCSAQVTIQDFTGTGSFSCPSNVTIACEASTDPEDTGTPTVTDVCGDNSSLTFSDKIVAGSGGVCKVIERTWVATDDSGTQTTCVQFISLVDTIAPIFAVIYNDTIVDCIDDANTADSIQVTDNCEPTYFAQSKDTVIMMTGNILFQRIWTATDSCNEVIDTQNVNIVDVTAPEINLPSDTFTYNTGDFVPDSCGVFVTIDFATFVTDCNESLGLKVGHSGQDTTAILSRYFIVGTHNVVVTAEDASGNDITKNVVIDVNDTSTPTIVCVENLVISLGTGGTGALQVANVLSSISDNCGGSSSIDTIFLSQTVFDCSDLGMNQVVLTAVDTSGNEGTCTINVEVVNQGSTDIISVMASSENESIGGAMDGSVSVSVSGGSGNYTYLWDDANASTSAMVSNLGAGLYSVTVNDTGTGCILTDTARVEAGSTVNYQICDGIGMQGDIVQIPVKVSNFDSILSIDMSFEISDQTVARFISSNKASGFNLADVSEDDFTYVSPSEMLFAINLNPTNGETLPDGTVIFNLNVEVVGTGGSAVISAGGNSVATIETTALINNSATVVASSSTTATITSGMNPVSTFGGNISTVANNPLPDVTVTLSGDATGTDVTDAAGDYTFSATAGQSLTVTPVEDRQHNQGLRVTDLAIIQNHILGNVAFTSPYQYIAADVNDNKLITVTDLAEIQAVILGIRSEFFTAPSWKFIPDDFAISLSDPFANEIPSSISIISENADFTAVKMGDVDNTATTVNLQTTGEAKSRETFRFGIEDRALRAGEIIEVAFKADNFQEMYAYQLTLNANPEWLSFEGIQAGELADINLNNFGLQEVERGLISTLWFAAEPQNIEQNATLFAISFRVNKGGRNLSDILRASSDRLDAAAYATDAQPKNISLAFDKNTALEGFKLFQNKPNPFSAQTTISFSVPKATSATLRFYDFSGRRVHQIRGDYAQGMNNVVVHKNDLAGSGVLYYEIETPTFTARKKMIVLD